MNKYEEIDFRPDGPVAKVIALHLLWRAEFNDTPAGELRAICNHIAFGLGEAEPLLFDPDQGETT